MNKNKRIFSIIAGISAIIIGLVIFGFMSLIYAFAKSCAESGQGGGLELKTQFLLTLYTLFPLVIAINGVLLINKKPENKLYRLIIHISLISLCMIVFVLGFITMFSGEESIILLFAIVPAIFAFISLLAKEKKNKIE